MRDSIHSTVLVLLLSGAMTAAAQTTGPHGLLHRYSFTADADDSVGDAHGVLAGGATVSGGMLQLDGLGGYLDLPNNLVVGLNSITIETWVVDYGSGGWARIYDFGNSTGGEGAQGTGTQYMFLSLPAPAGGGNLRGSYAVTGGGGGEQLLQWPSGGRPPVGHLAHIVWTTDGNSQQGRLYVDGALVGSNDGMTLTPADLGPTVNNWLGRSQWNGDAPFYGAIDEFRIYNAALSHDLVTSNYLAGPDALLSGPVRFIAHPQDRTVTEGDAVTFSAQADGTPPISFRWHRDGQPLPGETNTTLTVIAAAADHNAVFRLWASNVVDGATHVAGSSNAVLTVVADTQPPVLLRAQSLSTYGVEVLFSEPVTEVTATSTANYTLAGPAGPVAIRGATLDDTGRMATLTTPTLTQGELYTLAVSNVRDQSSSGNLIAPGTQAAFVATRYILRDIGAPDSVATTAPATDGFALTAGGAGIGGADDQFSFASEWLTGDFDRQLRVSMLELSDPAARAGLMARDGLDASSVFAASLATPGPLGCFFETRTSPGAAGMMAGNFPVNYPHTWLRLRREGNLFTGYASLDGRVWKVLGSVTIAAPETLRVGLALSSHDATRTTRAGFADAGPVVSPTVGNPRLPFEPLGRSSRRTDLVISEIMHHPAPRQDGRVPEFVELYNAGPVTEDLGGFRLEGSIAYTFPAGTALPPGGFLVVAGSPADVQAVYGLSGVHGPYEQSLAGGAGVVRLRHRAGAVLLEAEYAEQHPWPAAAAGAGHSLVLSHPSYGEGNREAWSASNRKGGSPGALDPVVFDPLQHVVINEFLAHTDEPLVDFIELYNHGNEPVDLSGAFLSDRADTNKFQIPAGTILAPRGHRVFDSTELGFALSTAGEAIYFTNPDDTRVIDAIIFDAQANAVSMGRSPDGAPAFRELAQRTPGAPNSPALLRDIVINEIMFHPPSGLDEDTYVELHNRGTEAVDLTDWRFVDGIQFVFPSGTVIPAGGYLVVAKDKDRLVARHPQLNDANTVGNYGGRLSNSGERIALAMQVLRTLEPAMYVVVDEVDYRDGGRWGDWINRGGSSLELVDPRGDNRLPSNWTGSDERDKGEWVTIEHAGVMDHGMSSGGGATELHILLPAAGECLIDEVQVFVPGGPNLVANSSFQNGLTGWIAQGNHVKSGLRTTEGFGDNRSLLLRATGGGDNGANRVKTVLTSAPSAGTPLTIRARARWLAGHGTVILRLRGNYLEAVGDLDMPLNLGTPGLPNTALAANTGPDIHDVSHHPVLPAANEPVLITARADDPDGIHTLAVRYRNDPSVQYYSVPMRDDGTGGDEVAGDGLFTATIPGQAADTMMAYSIEATDAHPSPVTTRYPDDAPDVEALIRFGESELPGSFRSYRMWFTQTAMYEWTSREKLSNQRLPGTLVYGNRVIHNIGARYRGSPFIRPNYQSPVSGTTIAALSVQVPRDDRMLGSREFNLDGLEQGLWGGIGVDRDETLQREKTTFWMAGQLGIPFSHQAYLYMVINGVRRGELYTDSQHVNSDYLSTWFPEDDGGELFKIDDWFEFNDDFSFNYSTARLANYTTTGGAKKQARYRWSWNKSSNRGLDDDYSNFFSLVDAVNTPGTDAYTAAVETVMDVDQWMRTFMLRRIVGDWDGYGYERGKNTWTYKPEHDRWKLLPWDLDFSLGGGSRDATHGLFSPTEDPTISRMYNHPPFRRAYLRAFHDAVEGPFQADAMFPVMDEMYAAFVANRIQVSGPGVIKNWVTARRAYVLDQLNAASAAFAITTNNGIDFSTAQPFLTLQGTAPVGIMTLTVNGHPYPATWTDVTTWQISLPLLPGANPLLVAGLDSLDQPAPGASRSITVTYTGAGAAPEDHLVINEIMHMPATANTEFVEIHNTSATHAFDLTGYRLRGIDFDFPAGTVIGPQGFLVIVKDRHAFVAKYGAGIPIAGVYNGVLQPDGERLSLVRLATDTAPELVLSDVTYSAFPPWPSAINDASLQLVDPAQGASHPGNWAVADENSPPPEPFTLLNHSSVWKFMQVSNLNAVTWTAPTYNDAPWPAGPGLLAFENNPAIVPIIGTTLKDPRIGTNGMSPGHAYYFRATVNVTGSLAGFNIAASAHVDDGAVFYVNGVEAHRLRMPATAILNDTLASDLPPTGDAVDPDLFTLPASSFGPGSNVIAVSVHQRTANSSDIVFGLQLVAEPTGALGTIATPGAPNSVWADLAPFPPLWINEIQPVNIDGPTDGNGDQDPWLELYNAGAATISLDGFSLTDTFNTPAKWMFPAGAAIGPGEFRVVWLDAQPGQGTADEWHAGFTIDPDSGSLFLFRQADTQPVVVDFLHYQQIPPDRSYGRFPDGDPGALQSFHFPTPGGPNDNSAPPVTVFINEWMAANTATIADPIAGQFDDWFELYNPGDAPADLSGYSLTDNLADPAKYRIPDNGHYVVPAGGFLLVWANNSPERNSIGHPDLHVSFALSRAGEAIALYAPDGSPIDAVTFGPQQDDVSEGRFPDGNAHIVFQIVPTPGAPNAGPGSTPLIHAWSLDGNNSLSLTFNSLSDRNYWIEYKDDLHTPTWIPAHEPIPGTGGPLTLQYPMDDTPQRYFRLGTN